MLQDSSHDGEMGHALRMLNVLDMSLNRVQLTPEEKSQRRIEHLKSELNKFGPQFLQNIFDHPSLHLTAAEIQQLKQYVRQM